ncbi:MAG: methyltransferase domain-containing protein [Sphingomicrobium sp.]
MPGAAFMIPDVRRFVSFRAFPSTCGWMVEAPDHCSVKVSFLRHDTREELSSRLFSGAFQPLLLPWPHAFTGPLDLRVEVVGNSKKAAFVANHRALSREWLFAQAIGKGVEIGPGPQPQILPSESVDVSYVEQMPPEEWNRLYNGGGKYPVRPELWSNYIVGEASNLPVPDHSLNFIFGSHVFEHLANPIGHLKRWQQKLAPGGKVICVVPDLAGTKDSIQEHSTLEEWRVEYEEEFWLPTERHYVRHLRFPAEHEIVREAMNRNESIHVHYYDNQNCQLLLDYAVKELGYEDYVMQHTPNHKDFHFVIRKA